MPRRARLEGPAGPADSSVMWDVAIIGAGPAGATAAFHLASRGVRVLLLDRHAFPRDKVCGDGLIADTQRCLARMRLLDAVSRAGCELRGALMFSPSGIAFEVPGRFVTLRRHAFDRMLVEHAVGAGAELRQIAVARVEPGADSVAIVPAAGERLTSRVCLLATGASVTLASRLGLVEDTRASATALRCYVRSAHPLRQLVFSWERSLLPGYGWIFPLPGGVFNIGVYSGPRRPERRNLRDAFDRFLRGFPLAAAVARAGAMASPVRGAMLRCGLSGTRARAGQVLVVGETLGTTLPFTGEGIGKAMESAEIAAKVASEYLASGDASVLASYPARLAAQLKPRFASDERASRWLAHPWAGDLLARQARRSAYVGRSLAGIVDDTADIGAVFSLRGLARSLLS